MYDAVPLPYGTDLHPPGNAQNVNGQIIAIQGQEVTAPAEATATSKAKTKSRGRKGTVSKEQRSTDLMEIDTNGISHLSPPAEEGNASELASPAVEDPEPVPQTTADIGDEKHTQSERVQHSLPESVTFELAPSISPTVTVASSIEHAFFAPSESSNSALLLAGQNVARICVIPTTLHSDYDFQQNQVNIEFQAPNLVSFNVLAFTWTPDYGMAVMAIWETFVNELGEKMSTGSIVRLLPGTGDELLTKQTLAKSVRDVVALEWNATSKSLLSLSITGNSSLLRVSRGSSDKEQPLNNLQAKKESGRRFYDAKWVNADSFVLCGEGVVAFYNVNGEDQIQQVKEISTNGQDWHRVLYDSISRSALFLSKDTDEITICRFDPSAPQVGEAPEGHYLPNIATDFALHPVLNPASLTEADPRLLAVTCETGEIIVFNIRNTWQEVARLALGMQKSAETCAWSEDGFLLAAAGDGRVVIWTTENITRQLESTTNTVLPRAVWVADSDKFGKLRQKPHVNGESNTANGGELTNGVEHGLATMEIDGQVNGNGHKHSDNESEISEDADLRHQKLVWHADGKALIYTVGDQVRIVTAPS